MEGTVAILARSMASSAASAGSTVARLMGVPREVEFIRNELAMMQSFLLVAAARPDAAAHNPMVGTWVKQVRDLSYDFEDCLSDADLYAAKDSEWSSWLPGDLATRHSIVKQIRDLKASLHELYQRNVRYRFVLDAYHDVLSATEVDIQQQLLAGPNMYWDSEFAYQESDIIGRSSEKEELIRELISGHDGCALGVVSVWGTGAIGKSSLVRMVRNDPELLRVYDCGAWLTVRHPLYSTDEFMWRLRMQLGLGTAAPHDDDHDIKDHLKDKRYLIVVDDLLTMEEWDQVWPKLLNFQNAMGSRIIVTTRRLDVAQYCARSGCGWHGLVYEVRPLGDEESIRLLCKKVYKTSMYTLPVEIEEQAKYIVRRCRGLPLAISAIGGLLATRPMTTIEWMKMHENLGAELEYDLPNAIKVIHSSYDNLPYQLKLIFLYLGIFPENNEIRRTRLLRRWMAEGYIAKSCNMSVEKVGDNFYNELIDRSIIQPSRKKILPGHRVDRCLIHNMVLQIILPKAVEENQLFLIDKKCNMVPQTKIRHLVVSRWKRGKKLKNINLSYIRSLTVYGDCPISLLSHKMRLMRVLDLEDATNVKNKDLSNLGNLPHLRYLSLRGTNISKLPTSLQNLRCLETLDIRDTCVTQLPHSIVKLEKLCYLVAGVRFSRDLLQNVSQLDQMDNQNNNLLGNKTSFACCKRNDYHKISNMEQLSVRAPNGIEKLRNLSMLGALSVGRCNGVARSLEQLKNLQKLGVTVTSLSEKGREEFCQTIGKLGRLQNLEVRSHSLEFLGKMDESLTPKHLASLKLLGDLFLLPTWIMSLKYLTKVKLLGTKLEQGQVHILGNLHTVAFLCLWEKSYIGESLSFSTGKFPKLKFLDIDGLENIETVTIEKGSMPKLEQLWVNNCKALCDSSDGLSGVHFLENLNELLVKKCGEKEKLIEILQQQVNYYFKRPKFLIDKSVVSSSSNPSTTAAAEQCQSKYFG